MPYFNPDIRSYIIGLTYKYILTSFMTIIYFSQVKNCSKLTYVLDDLKFAFAYTIDQLNSYEPREMGSLLVY